MTSKIKQSDRSLKLSKGQLGTNAGIELLSLCQTVTADGSLTKEEIVALRKWLHANKGEDIPAVKYLFNIVESIVADGVVTREELRCLHIAIETILPADIRAVSKRARRSIEETEKDRERLRAAREKNIRREEKEKNRPIDHWDFMVAGTRYEGRPDIIRRHVRGPDRVNLVRDMSNKHSRNAIAVCVMSGEQIGFVPEEDAVELAPFLDGAHPYSANIKKVLGGSSHPIPVVVVDIYGPDATLPDLSVPVSGGVVPTKPSLQKILEKFWR